MQLFVLQAIIAKLSFTEFSTQKVIVCTDGCANKGIGSLEGKASLDESQYFFECFDAMFADKKCRPTAEIYYKKLGVMALKKG